MNDPLADETTFCRFRNKLIEHGLIDKLLLDINLQLEESGLKVKNCDGAIVDATVIESSARPHKVVQIVAEDRKESDSVDTSVTRMTPMLHGSRRQRSIIMDIKGL